MKDRTHKIYNDRRWDTPSTRKGSLSQVPKQVCIDDRHYKAQEPSLLNASFMCHMATLLLKFAIPIPRQLQLKHFFRFFPTNGDDENRAREVCISLASNIVPDVRRRKIQLPTQLTGNSHKYLQEVLMHTPNFSCWHDLLRWVSQIVPHSWHRRKAS